MLARNTGVGGFDEQCLLIVVFNTSEGMTWNGACQEEVLGLGYHNMTTTPLKIPTVAHPAKKSDGRHT